MKRYLLLVALFSVAACQAAVIFISGNASKIEWSDVGVRGFQSDAVVTDAHTFRARCCPTKGNPSIEVCGTGTINGIVGWAKIEDGKSYELSC